MHFLKENRHLLGFGMLLAFLSSFGQTFLISLYLPSIQDAFELTDAGFSSIYAAATLASAFSLSWLGRFIDKLNIIRFTLMVMVGLIITLIVFSQAYYLLFLFLALFGLRLFGQGLLSHTSITSMARFFDVGRGKAISIASLGHPLGEMILPILVVTVIYAIGWRYAVLLTAIFVAMSMPYAFYLLRKNADFSRLRKLLPPRMSTSEASQAKPLAIIKSKAFWIIMPSSLASASIGTGFLLFKLKLGLTYGWSPSFVAIGFTAYAVGNALANLLSGVLADKYSGKKMFPFYLLPALCGLTCLLMSKHEWVYIALVAGIGITNGFGGTAKNVALAELYGVNIIGSVRSLFITVMVFSTALGPLLFGFLLDGGFTFVQIAVISIIIYILTTINSLRILNA